MISDYSSRSDYQADVSSRGKNQHKTTKWEQNQRGNDFTPASNTIDWHQISVFQFFVKIKVKVMQILVVLYVNW